MFYSFSKELDESWKEKEEGFIELRKFLNYGKENLDGKLIVLKISLLFGVRENPFMQKSIHIYI